MSERAIITGYALADMDERRKLEAEIERLRGLLKDAEGAIREADDRLRALEETVLAAERMIEDPCDKTCSDYNAARASVGEIRSVK